MNRVIWCASLLSIAFWGCQEHSDQAAPNQNGFDLAAFAGIYQDTLPVPQAVGNIVQLTIHADSTYAMVERTMYYEQKVVVPMSTAGKIQFEEGGAKWKLVPRNSGAKAWWLKADKGQLVVLDSTGQQHTSPGNFKLERISTALQSIGRDRLFSVDRGTVRFPLNVYGRPSGSNISVAKYYLQSCSEMDLALAFHYVNAFKGKLENTNPLALVVNKDEQTLSAMASRLVLSADGTPLQRPAQQTTLTSLVVDKQSTATTWIYTFLDANDQNWMGKDTYKLTDKGYVLAESVAPALLK